MLVSVSSLRAKGRARSPIRRSKSPGGRGSAVRLGFRKSPARGRSPSRRSSPVARPGGSPTRFNPFALRPVPKGLLRRTSSYKASNRRSGSPPRRRLSKARPRRRLSKGSTRKPKSVGRGRMVRPRRRSSRSGSRGRPRRTSKHSSRTYASSYRSGSVGRAPRPAYPSHIARHYGHPPPPPRHSRPASRSRSTSRHSHTSSHGGRRTPATDDGSDFETGVRDLNPDEDESSDGEATEPGVVRAIQRQIHNDEHVLSSRSLLRSSPAYNIHRVLMTAIENAALQETWRVGKDAFQLFHTMSDNGTGAPLPSSDWRMVEGQLLGQQLGSKLAALEEQLANLVSQAQPTPDDLSCEGLCKWAPQEVVAKAISTVAALEPADRSALERLAQNWREQLGMEEEFIQGIYHHLTHTVQMLWERILVMMDDVSMDVERTQFKFQRQLEHMVKSRSPEGSGRFAGLVGYNSFCVSNGLPLFEEAAARTFEEFCAHWKENHRILVQRRMLWQASNATSRPAGGAKKKKQVAAAVAAAAGDKPGPVMEDDVVSASGSEASDRGEGGESDADDEESEPSREEEEEEEASAADVGEAEHIRLLKVVRDTHVWGDGKRYCEVRAEAAWKEMISTIVTRVAKKTKKCRDHEQGLEVGRFRHLDNEFQRRVQTLRMEEFVLKARLKERAEEDPALARCCVALRRQRKPIRQHTHRLLLLRHLRSVRTLADQVLAKLQPPMQVSDLRDPTPAGNPANEVSFVHFEQFAPGGPPTPAGTPAATSQVAVDPPPPPPRAMAAATPVQQPPPGAGYPPPAAAGYPPPAAAGYPPPAAAGYPPPAAAGYPPPAAYPPSVAKSQGGSVYGAIRPPTVTSSHY